MNAAASNRSLIVSASVLFGVSPLLLDRWRLAVAVVLALIAVVARRRRDVAAFHLALVTSLVSLAVGTFKMTYWPLPLVPALGAYWVIAKRVGELSFPLEWLRRGRLDRKTVAWMVFVSALPAIALPTWFALVHPDYSHVKDTLMPPWPMPVLVAGVVVFSAFNAAFEEIVFRGAMLHSLDAAVHRHVGLLVQAAAFGIAHFRGFPGGASGVVLAGGYGIAMGIALRLSRGLLAPWLAHIFADVVIGTILLVTLF